LLSSQGSWIDPTRLTLDHTPAGRRAARLAAYRAVNDARRLGFVVVGDRRGRYCFVDFVSVTTTATTTSVRVR
jgi:hypothetical protein